MYLCSMRAAAIRLMRLSHRCYNVDQTAWDLCSNVCRFNDVSLIFIAVMQRRPLHSKSLQEESCNISFRISIGSRHRLSVFRSATNLTAVAVNAPK